jgi:hypothetical protein
MFEEAYGTAAMVKTQVYEWHQRFRDSRASVNDDPCCGRPSTEINDENIESVRNVVRSDKRKRVFMRYRQRANIRWKRLQYYSQRSEHALPLSTFGSKIANS